jgi:hypothetical protein
MKLVKGRAWHVATREHNARREMTMDALHEFQEFEDAGRQALESYEQGGNDRKKAIRFVVPWR